VVDAIERMVEDRLMLCEDVDDEVTRLIQLGVDLGVPPPEGGVAPPVELPRQCRKHDHDHEHHRRD